MDGQKRIALTAHDGAKPALLAWVFANESVLALHSLTATGNTGRLLMAETSLKIECVRSGALGGDLELGALIAEGAVDVLIAFLDPIAPKPHDIDPAPLTRICALTQTVAALNEATADFLIRSELLGRPYHRPRSSARALPPVTQMIDKRHDA